VLCLAARAEFIESWSVSQSALSIGWSWCDLDDDGVEELIKEDGLTTTFYNGADGYSSVWSVSDPSPCDSCSFSLFLQSEGIFVFLHQNVYEQQSTLHVYETYATSPLWSSQILEGSVTCGVLEDLDGDGELDLCFSWHFHDGENWSSSWELRKFDGFLLTSNSSAGFLNGPYAGNLEGDETLECLFNWYLADGTSILSCYGWSGTALSPGTQPETHSLRAFPNPFNPVCRLDVPMFPGVDRVSIYSIDGRLVRTLMLRQQMPGQTQQLIWDGLNQQGRPVASGVYIANAGELRVPMTLIR